jgi:hypothetical protein
MKNLMRQTPPSACSKRGKMLPSMEKIGDLARARRGLGCIRETAVADPKRPLLTMVGCLNTACMIF